MMIPTFQPMPLAGINASAATPIRFGNRRETADSYTFKTGQNASIPEKSFHLVEGKLRELVTRIKSGDYLVEPTSTRKWHRNFKHGFKIKYCDSCHKGRAYLQDGKVTLRPAKPNPESDVSAIYLHTDKKGDNYHINIRFELKQGGSASYHYAQNFVDGTLFEFTNAVAEEVLRVKNGEGTFDPDQFGDMKL